MNFTREPIIETIITPKEGFRLTVRSSKSTSQEEYSVEALEVVSFGHALFFRSTEKPRTFLLPISDYEVVETREAKIMLKSPTIDKTIKIAGGREQQVKVPVKEQVALEGHEHSNQASDEEKEQNFEKRKDKKKNRRKKAMELRNQEKEQEHKTEEKAVVDSQGKREVSEEVVIAAPLFSSLLPPPTTLISETIARYKSMESSENFMQPRNVERAVEVAKEEVELAGDVSEYVSGDDEELDQIWSHKQQEETFISSGESPKEEVQLEEEDEISASESEGKLSSIDEEKSVDLDTDKFIE